MKKIFLLLVLSSVSVFSISAQTNDKSTENPVVVTNNKAEKVELEKIETDKPAIKVETVKTEPVNANDQTPVTATQQKPTPPAAEKQTPQTTEEKSAPTIETVKKPESIETVKTDTVKIDADKTPAAETEKPAATSENVKTPAEPILQVKKPTLGGLSTGNTTIDGYIEEFSALFDVDPLLIYAQMSQESSFKARATSAKGASGFMQLMPATAARFGVTNVYNPKQNIKAGVKYMRWLLDKFGGDMRLALAGYNAGEGSVVKYGNKVPPYRETQNYVARIMTHYELITNQNSTLAQNQETVNK